MKITQQQKKQLKEMGKKHNIKLALIFGSRTEKGKPDENSDLDIVFALKTNGKEQSQCFGEIFNDFSEIFKGYNVDIVNIKDTDFVFKYEVYLNSELIIGDENDYLEFRARAYKEYADSQDLLRLRDILLKKKHKFVNL
ncbi:MAG: nucleotidyltransferase domain-containing protein [bacterium]